MQRSARRVKVLWHRLCSKYFVRAALWFALFALPWPGVAESYTGLVAAGFQAVLGDTGPPVELRFEGAEPGSGSWEVRAHVAESASGRFIDTGLDARRTGYLPSAVLLALALASRLRWRKQVLLVGIGLAVVHLLALLPIVAFLAGRLPIVAFSLSTPTHVAVDVLYRALVAPLGMTYALPALLWLLLSRLSVARTPEPRVLPQTLGMRRGRKAPAASRQRTGVTTR